MHQLLRDRRGIAAIGGRSLVFLFALILTLIPAASLLQRLDAAGGTALDLGGPTNNNTTLTYVTFGDPAALDVATFTLEAWVRRDGAGLATSTGAGGVTAVPIITKGRADADANTQDTNYFFGLLPPGYVLVADFEEYPRTGGIAGLNHPVSGVTGVPADGSWHHVAATYDGARWRLYLDGSQDAELIIRTCVGGTNPGVICPATACAGGGTCQETPMSPRFDSIERAALGSALTDDGIAAGFFNGVIDEARVWNVARTQAQIQATKNVEIAAPAAGLAARWGLNEGAGATVADTSGSGVSGTIIGANFAWVTGAPALVSDFPPAAALVAPPDGGAGVSTSPQLSVDVSDPDSSSLTVTFYGRQAAGAPPDFTVVALPDTQFYSQSYPSTWTAQTQWIVDNRPALNTAFVTGLGDCVQDGDTASYQWDNAEAAVSLLEDPLTTMLAHGIPYGITVGNHDQTPSGDPGTTGAEGATTLLYNQTFGEARFAGRPYYGGHYGTSNDNHYELFSASGMDFINISLEFDASSTSALRPAVLAWADALLKTHSGRRAIVSSHYLLNPNGTFGNQGQATYDALKNNPNLFLMLCGHLDQAARRSDVFNGRTVHTLLSDYQTQPNGGNGWLRAMTFRPGANRIDVATFSPTLNQFKTDAANQFSLAYTMMSVPFTVIATNSGVAPGSTTSATWAGLAEGTSYEWYVTVADATTTTTGPTWSFQTTATCVPVSSDDATCDGRDDDCDGTRDEDYGIIASTCGTGACASTGQRSCVNGTVQDTCVAGTPAGGSNLVFDGVNDIVDLGNAPAINDFGSASFTIEGWFKARTANVARAGIFRGGRQGAFSQVAVQLAGSAPFDRLTVSVEDTAGHQIDLNPVAIDLINQWNHFAAVVDRGSNQIRLYVNGALAGTADGSTWGTNPIRSTDSALLGAARLDTGAAGAFFDGSVDEVRVWRRALAQSEIQSTYQGEVVSGVGLAARWGLNEGSGTTTADSVGTSTGTLVNGTAWGFDTPVHADPGCDGVDDDCDGLVDEDFVSDASCGVGVCHDTNTPSACVNGVVTACQPGPAADDDTLCNGADDDCDGSADEDFVPLATTCGTGACTAEGTAQCVDGGLEVDCQPGAPVANYAVDFDGAGERVVFGEAPGLGVTQFTLEAWINRHGPGATASSGDGGVVAVPIVTKGRAESDAGDLNMNYFLGIRGTDSMLVADFEDNATGANHPVVGTTPLALNTWYHVAATYDGATWRLFVNGEPAGTAVANATPRADSIQHAAIATALNSTGVPEGWFDGVIDEVRIWNTPLGQSAIQANMGVEAPAGAGLVARYSFNEGTGGTVHDSAGAADDGVLSGGVWVAGTPLSSGPQALADRAIELDGTSGRVAIGPAVGLGGTSFTIETRFNRRARGVLVNTGTGGVDAIPLVTKGRAEADGSTLDMHYFLGIRDTDNVLVADFEDMATGANHPVAGITPIPRTDGRWHHAAAVYDGTKWSLYLDGGLEATLVVNALPRADSVQHAAIGTAMDSAGAAQGFFAGTIDEVRVWNTARSQASIEMGMFHEIISSFGLAGRWGFSEAAGTVAADSVGGRDGTISGGTHVDGYPYNDSPVFTDATCDGVDQDCDGMTDEDYAAMPTSCGTGACFAAGMLVCTSGAETDTCVPSDPSAEVCNGADDDCDGATDEDLGTTVCGSGACAVTIDNCVDGTPQTCDGQSGSGGPEICNGVDDDCDGLIDEDLGTLSCGTGACARTVAACAAGAPQTCVPGAPSDEVCNGADDDCDGATDEDLGTISCGTGTCARSVDACVGGEPQTCTPGAPNPEVCNGVDDDCDGAVDDDVPGVGLACTAPPGTCGTAVTVCLGASGIQCMATGTPASADVRVESGTSTRFRANGSAAGFEDTVLVALDSPMMYRPNTADPGAAVEEHWMEEGYDAAAAGWASGAYGVGYDTAAPPNALSLLRTPQVPATSFSVYTRALFDVADASMVRSLFLGTDYDDGFVAWINGVEVTRSSTMPAGAVAWNTNAGLHESSNAAAPNYGTLIDISGAASLLHDGANVLALGVWNSGAPTSTDLVVVPRLSIGLDWTAYGYDDTSWSGGAFGVGYETGATSAAALFHSVQVPPGSLSVFTRTHFQVADPDDVESVYISADYDDGYVAWINGVEVFGSAEMPMGALSAVTGAALHESSNGTTPNYGTARDVTARGRAALRAGDNVLAVGVWNNASTSTDLVLVPRLSFREAEICNGIDDDCDGQIDEGFPNSDGGATADCLDNDDDQDGVEDALDCAPIDSNASASFTQEVANFRWSRSPHRTFFLNWNTQGLGVRYDVVSGMVSDLRPAGGVSGAACATLPGGDDLAVNFYEDARPAPSPGQAYYYLVRSQKDGCDSGTYGTTSFGIERTPSGPDACP